MSALLREREIFANCLLLSFPAEHSGLRLEVLFSTLCCVKQIEILWQDSDIGRFAMAWRFYSWWGSEADCTHRHRHTLSHVLQRPRDHQRLGDHQQWAARTAFWDGNPRPFPLEGWKHSISCSWLINACTCFSFPRPWLKFEPPPSYSQWMSWWACILCILCITCILWYWRRKWQPTPVFLPRESQGQRSLVGCWLWGHTESDTTDAT